MDSFNAEFDKIQTQSQSLYTQMAAASKDGIFYKEAYADLVVDYDNLSNEKYELQEKVYGAQDTEAAYEASEFELRQAEGKLEDTEEKLARKTGLLRKSVKTIKGLREKVEILREDAQERDDTIEMYSQDEAEAQKQVEEMRHQQTVKDEEYQQQAAGIHAQYQQQVEDMHQQLMAKEHQIICMKNQFAEHNIELQRVRHEYATSVAELEPESRNYVSDHQNEYFCEKQTQVNKLLERNKVLEAQVAKMVEEKKAMQNRIDELTHELDLYGQKIMELQAGKEQSKSKMAGFQLELEEIKQWRAEMQAQGGFNHPGVSAVNKRAGGELEWTYGAGNKRAATPGMVCGFEVGAYDGDGHVVDLRTINPEIMKEFIKEICSFSKSNGKEDGATNFRNRLVNRRSVSEKTADKCLHRRYHNKNTESPWTVQGPRKFACRACTNAGQVCCIYDKTSDKIILLPLVSEIRGSALITDADYYVAGTKGLATKNKALFQATTPKSKANANADPELVQAALAGFQ
jgi:hypothetical protein